MLRILSDKQFASKRGVIVNLKGRDTFAIKWDPAIAGQKDSGDQLWGEKKISKSLAAQVGVSAVLGESDWNPANATNTTKDDKKTVRFDDAPLFNDRFGSTSPYIIRGSFASRMALEQFAGSNTDQLAAFANNIYRSVDLAQKRYLHNDQHLAVEFINQYNKGIDIHLLKRIAANIARDPQAKEGFISFMEGVIKAIELCEDKSFFQNLEKKYQAELGDEALKEVQNCRLVYESNVRETKSQYAKYIDFYHQILSEKTEEKASVVPPIAPKGEVEKALEVATNILSEDATKNFVSAIKKILSKEQGDIKDFLPKKAPLFGFFVNKNKVGIGDSPSILNKQELNVLGAVVLSLKNQPTGIFRIGFNSRPVEDQRIYSQKDSYIEESLKNVLKDLEDNSSALQKWICSQGEKKPDSGPQKNPRTIAVMPVATNLASRGMGLGRS